MIVSEVLFGIRCDRCRSLCVDGLTPYFLTQKKADENAVVCNWISEYGGHYCPSCHDVQEGLGIVVKPKLPSQIFAAKRILGAIFGEQVSFKECLGYYSLCFPMPAGREMTAASAEILDEALDPFKWAHAIDAKTKVCEITILKNSEPAKRSASLQKQGTLPFDEEEPARTSVKEKLPQNGQWGWRPQKKK